MSGVASGLYKPSKWGHEFHNLPHDEALGAGSAGPGKSMVLLMDPIYQVVEEHRRCADPNHPHHIEWGTSVGWALHLRRTMPMLEQTIQRAHRIFPKIDPGVKWDSRRNTFIFSSGYRYQFGHCKEFDDWQMYQSAEFTYIAFDEAVQFTEEQYDQITTRLRTADPVLSKSLKVRLMSNPMMTFDEGVRTRGDPQWVRRRFVDPAPMGRVTLTRTFRRGDGTTFTRTRIYLPATLYDNPDPEFVRQYEEKLLDKPPHIRKALLYGDWYLAPGSYYGDVWIKEIHVCRPFKIPDDWPQWRSMDWGFKAPGCVHWYARDPDGNIFVHRELTFQGKDVAQVAAEIEKAERAMGLWKGRRSLITGPADTQLWEKRGDIGKDKATEFAERGIPWLKADKRSRARNAQLLVSRLMDHGNMTTTPGIVFFSTCVNAIRTLPTIPTDPKDPEVPLDGGEDHWHDSILYGVAYASRDHLPIPRKDDYDYEPEPVRHGKWGYGMEI